MVILHRSETATHAVLRTLHERQDFMTRKQIKEKLCPGFSASAVCAALYHLWRTAGAIDCVLENDGTSWWFALPEGCDKRMRPMGERKLEDKPRKKRKPKGGAK